MNENRIAYVQDEGGDENIHIYAVNIDGTNNIDLTPFENVQARITDDLEDDPDFMLVALNKRIPQIHDVYRLNVNSGDMEMIAENPGNISGWVTDNDGKHAQQNIRLPGLGQKRCYVFSSKEWD